MEGRYDAASQSFKQGLRLAEEIGARPLIVRHLYGLARIDVFNQHLGGARKKLFRVLDISKQTESADGKAMALHELGSIDLVEGDLRAAKERLCRALVVRRVIGKRAEEAET